MAVLESRVDRDGPRFKANREVVLLDSEGPIEVGYRSGREDRAVAVEVDGTPLDGDAKQRAG